MSNSIRLLALVDPETRDVHFHVDFSAPLPGSTAPAAPAILDTGDGSSIPLGELCAPDAATWHEQRAQALTTHRYGAGGPYTAHLHWGEHTVSVPVSLTEPQLEGSPPVPPQIRLFEVKELANRPLEVMVRLQVIGMPPDQHLRIDAGAEHVRWIKGEDGEAPSVEWTLAYAKPGSYTVALDLLDANGYWLAGLGETPLEVAAPPEKEVEPKAPQVEAPTITYAAPAEIPAPALVSPPWLPFRYARPLWSWSNTYTTPGGGQVARTLTPGTYLSIRSETVVGGSLWYQTAGQDWVAASTVDLVVPSELRGVELGEPDEPPPPGETRQGVVTATVLNVRARPGVSSDNPPIDQLPYNAPVTIYEEQFHVDALWYRIGVDRWVHSGWVRLLDEDQPPGEERTGVVTATVLNVRAQPGVRPDNPPIDQLPYNTQVTIYEEQLYVDALWYRIGVDRWVHSGWVHLLPGRTLDSSSARTTYSLPVGWVVSASLNVRAQPGVRPDNPPVDQVQHNQPLSILETRTVEGVPWYRIGEDRWVYGEWVAVANFRARPASIGSQERWVGVNLRAQTAVAYEGDRPVYAAMIASGLPGTPTVQGIFRTWWRLNWRRMAGGRPGAYYYLEDVTWTCYFYSGYALHTAYWHDAFGRPRSHGCVNMSPYDAWWIFQWSAPGGANSPAVYVYSA